MPMHNHKSSSLLRFVLTNTVKALVLYGAVAFLHFQLINEDWKDISLAQNHVIQARLKMHQFHPVIKYPKDVAVKVLDLSKKGDLSDKMKDYEWSIGKYNEERYIYDEFELFHEKETNEIRNIHMGIDFGAPINTPVFAFCDGVVMHSGIHFDAGNYGGTVVLKCLIENDFYLYSLYGHLSHASTKLSFKNKTIKQGEIVGFIGNEKENGQWPPHLHFQLSKTPPSTFDLPGAVSKTKREEMMKIFLDPRLVLGNLYNDD